MPGMTSQAQRKVEKESRIKVSAVPAKAVLVTDRISSATKWKWYREQGIEETTIEAKGKAYDRKCSVEFDTEGNLQDVEVVVKFTELPDSTQLRICESLNDKPYTKIKILRVQDQFVGEVSEIIKAIQADPLAEVQHRYELVVEAHSAEDGQSRYEYTFDTSGAVLKVYKIVLRNMDNLEY